MPLEPLPTQEIPPTAGTVFSGRLPSEAHESIERALELARLHLGLDVAFLAQFRDGEEVFRVVEGDAESFGLAEDTSVPVEETYCVRMVRGEIPNVVPEAHEARDVRDLPITDAACIGAYIGVPVRSGNGSIWGTLCCLSHDPQPLLDARDVSLLRLLADLVAEEIVTLEAETWRRELERARVEEILDREAVSIHLQPIFDLEQSEIVAFEALARFGSDVCRPTSEWFAIAREVGLGRELELLAVRTALARLPDLPAGRSLALNVLPDTAVSAEFSELLAGLGERVVVEVTEHAPVENYEDFESAVAELRTHGTRLAVDDVGAGYSSLMHIVSLHPEILKLDASLTKGIDADPARRALASSLLGFASAMDAVVVAEGIETRAELEELKAVGIEYGQGYHLGRPRPDVEPDPWVGEDAVWEPILATGRVEEYVPWRTIVVWLLFAALAWVLFAATGFALYKLLGLIV
jgi:EAL domain-containing protein (putative c-di-GMP-specific phosphodiesterase class I)